MASTMAAANTSNRADGSSSAKLVDEDAMYQAFFSAVGSKPNESYDKLLTLLPSARSGASVPGSSVDTSDSSTSRRITPPPAELLHPLTKEWLDAAEAMDDDVPLEEGEWLDVSGAPKEPEVLDEEGIPVVSAISRTSSCCILDAPGAVQVDNFTDFDGEAGEERRETAALSTANGYIPSALSRQPQARLVPASTAEAAHGVTAVASRPTAADAVATAGQGPASSSARGTVGSAALLPTGPVFTLEDEIKAMRNGTLPGPTALERGESQQADCCDEEGSVELIDPGRRNNARDNAVASNGLAHPDGSPSGDASVYRTANGVHSMPRRSTELSRGVGAAPQATDHAEPAQDRTSEQGVVATLPGECLVSDSGAEAQLMSVNTQDMLERMGLGEGQAQDNEDVDLELDLTHASAGSPASATTITAAMPVINGQHSGASGTDAGAADECVTFVEVEGFKLDPDFDYDNVKLTPREFPYNLRRSPAPFGCQGPQ